MQTTTAPISGSPLRPIKKIIHALRASVHELPPTEHKASSCSLILLPVNTNDSSCATNAYASSSSSQSYLPPLSSSSTTSSPSSSCFLLHHLLLFLTLPPPPPLLHPSSSSSSSSSTTSSSFFLLSPHLFLFFFLFESSVRQYRYTGTNRDTAVRPGLIWTWYSKHCSLIITVNHR
ncbi:unnamed protein product [Musa hybrid cultivar]